MIRKLLFLIPIVSFVCVSCDPATSYSRIIKNDSSHEIYVIKKNFPVCDTTTIGLGEKYTVYQTSSMTSTGKYEDCTFDSYQKDTFLLSVKDNPSLTVNASVMSNQSWQFSVTHKTKMGHGGTCNCTLTITNDMIQ